MDLTVQINSLSARPYELGSHFRNTAVWSNLIKSYPLYAHSKKKQKANLSSLEIDILNSQLLSTLEKIKRIFTCISEKNRAYRPRQKIRCNNNKFQSAWIMTFFKICKDYTVLSKGTWISGYLVHVGQSRLLLLILGAIWHKLKKLWTYWFLCQTVQQMKNVSIVLLHATFTDCLLSADGPLHMYQPPQCICQYLWYTITKVIYFLINFSHMVYISSRLADFL